MKFKGLIVVESPTKVRTIKKVVGDDYEVRASVGHIKDLPKNRLGVNVENGFEPEYELIKGKKKVLEEIKRLAREAEEVYLASDPDREGEAIAWHIAEYLRDLGRPIKRLLLNEITKRAILEALKSPAELDPKKYEAQQTRRVLDRLVGYNLSPLLWEKVKRGLSAGRVQSVALRLVCEREEEIRRFKPKEYWTIEAEFLTEKGGALRAKLERIDGRKAEIGTGAKAEELLARIKKAAEEKGCSVSKVVTKLSKKDPPPPFVTSTLQQEAFKRFRFPAKKTMFLAQRLYEGVEVPGEGPLGLITYMRTDSVRVSEEAKKAARRLVEATFGREYLPERPPEYRLKGRVQDAHEAIRPTRFDLPPERLRGVLSEDELKLYELIWTRFLASQMAPALFEVTTVEVAVGEGTFVAKGKRLVKEGFLTLSSAEKDQLLPELSEGDSVFLKEVEAKQHFTKPPSRYTEATLIRTLEEKGIGRPSTYAQIVSTIKERGYVESNGGTLKPTELGMIVNELLVSSFPKLIETGFTARMESFLDDIAEGKGNKVEVLRAFYEEFLETLRKAEESLESLKAGVRTGVRCPECGEEMLLKVGRAGPFLACSSYPRCKFTGDYERDSQGRIRLKEDEGLRCPECGGTLALKRGKYGEFLACRRYPECRYTKAVGTGVRCPECGAEVVKRRSKKGKTYYACENRPECEFVLWDEPVKEPCPHCGASFTVLKGRKRRRVCPFCNEEA